MSQKILASHCDDDALGSDLIEVRVDQVVLAREPSRVLGAAVDAGLGRCQPEVCVAYPPHCVSLGPDDTDPRAPQRVPQEALSLGFLVARPGAGFASAVHLERFGSPARLLLSDEPRMVSCGAVGMLAVPASRSQLTEALLYGKTHLRPARSIHISLTGRLRPFVCSRDATLELLRLGLRELVESVDGRHHAPVVLEFGGNSAKYLSVGERAVFCALAPQVGAAGALFSSDDKTEAFLRDQRRSKAHRVLAADSGTQWEDVLTLDLASIDPLLQDDEGRIRPVRELEGRAVEQVLLGGDTGASLRDLLAAAALLKSKRVFPGVEFLFCPPTRQVLEVLARGEALNDLLATGARLLEPDRRALSGELYSAPADGLTLRSADRDREGTGIVASAETLAFAVAHGQIGDPRQFKRPVRVAVPRSLPTDDVLLSRGTEARGGAKGKGRVDKRASDGSIPPPTSERFANHGSHENWSGPLELALACIQGAATEYDSTPSAYLALNLDEVRRLAEQATETPQLRAIIAAHIPAATVSILSGLGVLALRADEATLAKLSGKKCMRLPAPQTCTHPQIEVRADDEELHLEWLARGAEREWTSGNN